MKKMMRTILLAALLTAAFALGYLMKASAPSPPAAHTAEHAGAKEAGVKFWTCSMHPQIQQPKPGRCPLCGMELIPVMSEAGEEEAAGPAISLSPQALKRAQVEVAPVERRFVTAEIRMVGKVDYDETRLASIAAWVPGRIDRLYVDYTGTQVNKGDHLVYLYSPELLTAQRELLEAKRSLEELQQSDLESVRETAALTLEAAREKLRLLGLTPAQIAEIEQSQQPSDHLTIYSPIGGIVIHKNAVEGMYVQTGTKIYTIADLSHLWVRLDAYESDLSWLRYGQEVEFEAEAYPGERFTGTIAFIAPVLSEKTRTVKVRVNVPNPEGKLKPGLFVRAVVRSQVAAGGKVLSPELAGKWISPMHPEIVKDEPGFCDICGMPLVRAETLGYVGPDAASAQPPLVIPASAPLITGKRAVVYVQLPDSQGSFEGREVVLGPRAGDHYTVEDGLVEGELVVVKGNFKIDSAIQIQAKPSMMNPEGGAAAPVHQHGGTSTPPASAPHGVDKGEREIREGTAEVPEQFRAQIEGIFSAYFRAQQALSRDEFPAAQEATADFLKDLKEIDMNLLSHRAHEEWMKQLRELRQSAGGMAEAQDIEKLREHFALLSESLYLVGKRFGTTGQQPVFLFHCAMAFNNRGAHWLQNKKEVANPYFGKTMPKCGEQKEVLIPALAEAQENP